MNRDLKTLNKEIDDFFSQPQTAHQKAWGIIHDFYHQILTFMEENNITKSDLARRLGKSRSAMTQMFNKTPNISILKMVEIASAIGVELNFSTDYFDTKHKSKRTKHIEYVYNLPHFDQYIQDYTSISSVNFLNSTEDKKSYRTEFKRHSKLRFEDQLKNY